MSEINERVAVLENQTSIHATDIKTIFKELKYANEITSELNATMKVLNVNIINLNEGLTSKVNLVSENVTTLSKEVKAVAETPKKRYELVVASIITAVITSIIAILVSKYK